MEQVAAPPITWADRTAPWYAHSASLKLTEPALTPPSMLPRPVRLTVPSGRRQVIVLLVAP